MLKVSRLVLLMAALLPAFAMTNSQTSINAAQEQAPAEKKYKLSACAFFKNESAYLKEWLEYHQMVGVDHFYLYDNGSNDRPATILAPYIRKGLVTFLRWPDRMPNRDDAMISQTHWALSTQIPAYENAIKRFGVNESEWLVFLDIDEFLVPVNANSVGEVLENHRDNPGFELTCECFDASQRDSVVEKDLVISYVNLTQKPTPNVIKTFEKLVFRPEQATSFTWPPYRCNFEEGKEAPKISKAELRINKYLNRNKGELNFGKIRQKLRIDSRSLSDNEKSELLQIGYALEDNECVIKKFEPGLRKRLGKEQGWRIINE